MLINQRDIQNRRLENPSTSSVHTETPGARALGVSDFGNKAAYYLSNTYLGRFGYELFNKHMLPV